jgi:hypothetical protein
MRTLFLIFRVVLLISLVLVTMSLAARQPSVSAGAPSSTPTRLKPLPVSGSTPSPRKALDTFRIYLPLISKSCQIQVDGNPSDWQGAIPIAYGNRGDSAATTPGGDLIHFYACATSDATYFLWEMNGPITDPSLGFQFLVDKNMDGVVDFSGHNLILYTQLGICPSSMTVSGWTCAFGGRYLEMGIGSALLPPFEYIHVTPLVINPSPGATLDQLACHPDVYLHGTLQRPASETQDLTTRAAQVHLDGWHHLLEAAQTDLYYRYGIYSSRVLAVKNPEVYLLADIAFLNDIQSHPYRPYVLTNPAVTAFPVVRQHAFFPSDYPFLPFLDRRTMGPVSTLKNVRNLMLTIDRAALTYYLQRSSRSLDDLYIVYTDSDQSYLSTPDGLLDVTSSQWVSNPQGNPVLIFNENAVWYPLLQRDDRGTVPSLATIVTRYAGAVQMPTLTPDEQTLIDGLRQTTGLGNSAQLAVAVLAASKGFGLPSVRARIYDANAGQALEWGQDTLILARDTRISPVAAYLVAIGKGHDAPRRWFEMSAEMADQINVRCRPEEDDFTDEYSDGFFDPWDFEHPVQGVPMARVNLNDIYYSHAGGDDGRVHAVAEIIEMLGADPYIFYDARTRLDHQIPSGGPPHLLVPAATVKFESTDIAAGLIFNGVLLWPAASISERAMEFFYHNGKFAAVIINQYQGSMSPTEAGQVATYFHNLYTDDRYFVGRNGLKWQPINYNQFMLAIPGEQARWVPLAPLP